MEARVFSMGKMWRYLAHPLVAISLLLAGWVGLVCLSHLLPAAYWIPLRLSWRVGDEYFHVDTSRYFMLMWITNASQHGGGKPTPFQMWILLRPLGFSIGQSRFVNQTTTLLRVGLFYFPIAVVPLAILLWHESSRRRLQQYQPPRGFDLAPGGNDPGQSHVSAGVSPSMPVHRL
jgi:hypothetical protein